MTQPPNTSLPERLRTNIARAVVGKPEVIDLTLATLLAGGHLLVEDVPGLGKTLLAKAVARSLGGRFSRVQFTPDLLPSDITGTTVLDPAGGGFGFRPGPVFANILLGDELNRATPRTQSALLEAMEERQVTVDGTSHALPDPFFVIATQNPVEQQGVYDLPEAQLDRFLMKITVGYPSRADEVAIVTGQLTARPIDSIEAVATEAELAEAMAAVRALHVDETLVEYAVRIVEATRSHSDLILGASPRASLALVTASRAMAWLRGARYVTPDDMKRLAAPVLRHRLMLKPQATLGGRTADALVAELLETVELPLLR